MRAGGNLVAYPELPAKTPDKEQAAGEEGAGGEHEDVSPVMAAIEKGNFQGPPDLMARLLESRRANIQLTEQMKNYENILKRVRVVAVVSY